MDIRKEINDFAADEDKPILHWLFDHYHYQSEWRIMAKSTFKRYGKLSYESNRVWAPTNEGRILYAHSQDKPISKSGELDRVVKRYIIDQIDGSGYDKTLTTDKEKVKFLKDTFYAEYSHEIVRRGELKALAEYFSGLPSCCNIAFTNFDILQLAKKWGSLPENPTERQEIKILDNWWNLLANKTLQLFRKYSV